MLSSGRVVFGEMDEVVFGKPAPEAVARQAQRLGATRVFLMVRRRKAASPVKDQVSQIAPSSKQQLLTFGEPSFREVLAYGFNR